MKPPHLLPLEKSPFLTCTVISFSGQPSTGAASPACAARRYKNKSDWIRNEICVFPHPYEIRLLSASLVLASRTKIDESPAARFETPRSTEKPR
jgi:hypothetical protein